METLVDFNNRLLWKPKTARWTCRACARACRPFWTTNAKAFICWPATEKRCWGRLCTSLNGAPAQRQFYVADGFVCAAAAPQTRVFKALFRAVMDFYHSREDIIGLRFYVDKTNTAVVPLYKKVGWKESNYNLWEIKKHD